MNPASGAEAYGQQYNLKWTNHTNNILQMFGEHLMKECLVDVTLSCEGRFIKAHKMILSACSPYFQELFQIHTVPHPLIIMNGVTFPVVKQIIDFMYQGEIKVKDEDLDQLLMTAENLQVKGLCTIRRKKDITEHLPQTLSNTPAFSSAEWETCSSNTPLKRKRQKQSCNSVVQKQHESEINGVNSTSGCAISHKLPKLLPTKDTLTISSDSNVETEESADDKIKQNTKIPRPPNAFMIFANEWRKKLAIEHQGESNKEISVRLGNMWKSFSGDTKQLYYLAAKKADDDHKVKYPGYYYSPKEARLRKGMKGNNSQKSCTLQQNSSKDIETKSSVQLVFPDSDEVMVATEEHENTSTKLEDTNPLNSTAKD